MHYVDGPAFGRLFGSAGDHHGEICTALHAMARGLSGAFRWPGADVREDAVSAATCHAIQRVGSVDPARADRAFGYFTRVIETSFLKSLAREKKRRAVEKPALADT